MGISWGFFTRGRREPGRRTHGRVLPIVLLLTVLSAPGFLALRHPAAGPRVALIVRARPGLVAEAEKAVRAVGGDVGRPISIIDGFVARVPSGGLERLASDRRVSSVTQDESVQLADWGWGVGSWYNGYSGTGYNPADDPGSLYNTNVIIGAQNLWRAGYTGRGVDVAVIDSGIAPVDGLNAPGKVINGPDLSPESQAPALQYLDSLGHGTFMAGIIAGHQANVSPALASSQDFMGVAPDSRIVSIKVADAKGNTDVSQIIAAIDWVVQHKTDHGMNIRVLNLSFGTNSRQDYKLDPLAYAAEVAWRKGIVVVVSAGNLGRSNGRLTNPAIDPYLIAVGADDTDGTLTHLDDHAADFSNAGDGVRNPDLIAPGVHIQSLRVPGSYIDDNFGAKGRINDRYFRGSGTSQATAVVAGAAALLLQQRPGLTPDQVKAALVGSTENVYPSDRLRAGAGLADVRAAAWSNPVARQTWVPSTGAGSLEASRGGAHISDRGVQLTGEKDIFGKGFNSVAMAILEAAGSSWSGGTWNGSSWSGSSWSGSSWSGSSWSGSSWSGSSWSGSSWSGSSWSSKTWTGSSWSGSSWSGSSWSGSSWSGGGWA